MDLKTHLTTGKVLGLAIVLILVIAGISRGCGGDAPRYSDADQAKIDALNDAYKNGLVSQSDYQEKLREIKENAVLVDADDSDNPPKPGGKVEISGRTKTVEVQDPVFQMTALRAQVPADWNFEGIVIRDDGCQLAPSFAWRLTSPDGLSGAQLIPQFNSAWSDDPIYMDVFAKRHCKTMEPMSAEDLLQYIAPFTRPDPTIGPVEPIENAQKWIDQNKQTNRLADFSAVHSRIEYEYRGQTIEEDFAVRMMVSKHAGSYSPKGPTTVWTTTAWISTYRAPKGQLNKVMAALMPLVGGDLVPDEWKKRSFQKLKADMDAVTRWTQQQNQQTFEALERNHQAFMQAQQEKVDQGNARAEEQMEAMHRSAQAYVLYASDEQLFRNPDTGTVIRAPIEYGDHAWQDPISRNILMSDSPDLNLNLFLRASWTQLEHVNPMNPDQ